MTREQSLNSCCLPSIQCFNSLASLVLAESDFEKLSTSLLYQIFGENRQVADSFAGGGEYRICHRRCNQRHTGLAYSRRRFRARDDVYFDLRHLVHSQQGKIVEIALLSYAFVDSNGALYRRLYVFKRFWTNQALK